ncbi:putative RNA-directed DNA polymerase from transposon X-element [Colletotrichum aenigma]|uniref:putative RNA-directed DNA polymerase from transposon X-element n=1 Tax=Colletotrichum aenigma TaxID=1215731 RepID=UPI0018729C6D|nr:putative RNA-directed DNA polymerase from transposon X-element [Colletotrichum aenigma]KAF5517530.1 putative RNA-directed DNA polymerase from transposon X-element [Colletotrichum aenigma]
MCLTRFQATAPISTTSSPDVNDLKWALEAASTGKACDPDQVAVDVFKKCPGVFYIHLTRIMNACLRLEYHPDEFKRSITVVLRKLDRTDFSLPKSWRPVALLSCLGKLLERVVAKRIQELAVKRRLIPRMQFGFPGRCTTKCIESLLSPVYRGFCVKTRNKKKWRSTLLSLDISGAYDHVNRPELLRILVRKGMPDWIVNLIWSFLSDRRTMLRFPGYVSEESFVNTGIPQGSPLSPILFVFFSAPMLEKFERLHPDLNVFAFSYVDDSYILVTSRTLKENREILEKYHEQVMEWATPNGIRFDPGKYKVMHFTRNEKCDLYPRIPGLTVKHVINNSVDPEAPKYLRILGVMVDPALKWDAHIANLESKVKKKLGFLKRISSSVMGPNLIDMRRLYITSVRPIITYACACWFVLADGKGQPFRITKKLIARLDRLQRECLVEISGAYSQTPVMVLQKELNIEPIEVALHRIATAHRVRNTNTLEGERMLKIHGDSQPLGKNWVQSFIKRNPSFKHLAIPEIMAIKAYNRYNMDETGILEVPWLTPKKRDELQDQFSLFSKLDTDEHTQRLLFRKVQKGFDEKAYQLAVAQRKIEALQAEVDASRVRKRKKVKMSPNSKFADIEAIRRAQIEAGELESSTDESSESENPSDSESCIVVAS